MQKHLEDQHAGAAGQGAVERAHQRQAAINRARQGPQPYEGHRTRLGRLLRAVQRAEGLCVLGAGNCDDLDLPMLSREFGRIDLVDLDGEALGQALERVPPAVRARLCTHAGLDLSGAIDRLERWGDEFPAERELADFAGEVSGRIAQQIPGRFDVVLSACLLSQLYLPLRETLLLGLEDWQRLFGAIERAHLATVIALTRPGGTGVLALDITSSAKLPELASFVRPETWDGLGPAAAQAMASRKIAPSPDPARLLQWLAAPELAPSVDNPRLTEPWVWDTGGGTLALVQALVFSRR